MSPASLSGNYRLSLRAVLSRVIGTEHDQITRFILGLIIDVSLHQPEDNNPSNIMMPRLLSAIHAILDFVYLASGKREVA